MSIEIFQAEPLNNPKIEWQGDVAAITAFIENTYPMQVIGNDQLQIFTPDGTVIEVALGEWLVYEV